MRADVLCLSSFWKVFLVDASTTETITSDLHAIARNERIGNTANDALLWLSGHHEEWLLLFDNADDTKINLRDFFPICSHGNILITSRNPELCFHAPHANCRVSEMEYHDAIDLLLTVAGEQHMNEARSFATPIIQELGHLALAIVQAGAYIRKSCSITDYLQIYRKNRDRLLEQHHIQRADGYKWTVYTTWQISFEKLSSQATVFLQLCAFLHHTGISREIFRNAAAVTIVHDMHASAGVVAGFLQAFQSHDGWDDLGFSDLISELCSYSLIEVDKGKQVFSIHPLVHAWIRTILKDSKATQTSTLQLLSLSITQGYEVADYAFRRTLLPHIDEAYTKNDLDSETAEKLAQVYSEGGCWKKAEELQVKVMETRKRMLGEDHFGTWTSIANLASTFQNQGWWNKAEELQVTVMETMKRVLGEDHPHTLISIGNLASTLQRQGQWNKAEELQVKVMETMKGVFGEDHPHTLTNIANLALIFQGQGQWKKAEVLQVKVMETRRRVLGEDHPDTLISIGNLALTFQGQGQWNKAEELQVKVVGTMKRVLGEDHPNTLKSIGNLALIFQDQGQWNKAKKLGVKVMKTSKRVLASGKSKVCRGH